MGLHLAFVLFISCLISLVRSDALPNVYKHGCVLLGDQHIYCHGGASRSASSSPLDVYNDEQMYSQLMRLDVSQPLTPSQASSQWQSISSGGDYTVESRSDFAMAAYNGTNFMVVGGMGPSAANSSGIATVAARYNANLNQWFPLAAVNPSSATINTTLNTLTFGVRATQISADELLILGGTLPNNHTVLPGWTQNVDVMASNGSWNQFVAEGFSLTGAAGPMRLLHHAMATGSDGQAYSFGGISPANASTNDYLDAPYINLNSTVVYHNSSIMAVNISGQAPTVRQMHTATALPTSQILIYGGFNDQNQVVSDTSYLYNIKSQSWEAVNLNGTGPGPRYGHSAVLVNDTLYIIGGVDSSGQARNDVSLLNVTSWTWVQNSGSDTNSSNDNGSHSLHGGAVAGVVIGVLVAVGLIAGGAFYFIRRRRLASEKTRFNSWSNTDVDSQTKEIRY